MVASLTVSIHCVNACGIAQMAFLASLSGIFHTCLRKPKEIMLVFFTVLKLEGKKNVFIKALYIVSAYCL